MAPLYRVGEMLGGGRGGGKQPEIYGIHYQSPEAETSWRPGTKTRGMRQQPEMTHTRRAHSSPWGRTESSRKPRELTPTGLWLTESQVEMEAV
jgi:hypothetical protein